MAKRTGTTQKRKDAAAQLSFDTHLLDVYLTGLQAEVEAKLRRVARFREQMQKVDAAGGRTDLRQRKRAAVALVTQIDEMLETNLIVRGTLKELREVASAVRRDIDRLVQ